MLVANECVSLLEGYAIVERHTHSLAILNPLDPVVYE